jgi:ribosomal protein L11 methyltransferase
MRWIELSSSVDPDLVEKATSILGRYSSGGAVVEEPEFEDARKKSYSVKIYLLYNRSYHKTRQEIEQELAQLPFPVRLSERLLKPEDWLDSLKKHFGILEIGEKFIIKPSWVCQSLPPSTRILIELDPGAAFGTGLHPTTRLCLLCLEKYLQPGMSVLDMGTGSGILSIAAAKLGAASILAVDIDPAAVKAAQSNVKANRVDKPVQVRRGTLSLRIQRDFRDSFDMILANITARAIADLSQGLSRVLKPEGILITSGIHPQGLDEVLIRLSLANFKFKAVEQDGEWYAVIARKG